MKPVFADTFYWIALTNPADMHSDVAGRFHHLLSEGPSNDYRLSFAYQPSSVHTEIWSDMPDEVRAKLPPDGASQHDHYIYGVPKSEQ